MPKGACDNFGEVKERVPRGGTSGQVLSKRTDRDHDLEWVTSGAGSGDVTKDELASGSLVTTIGDTEHIPISVAGSPNSIKKIVWTAFKTVLDGIYALAGHTHAGYVTTTTTVNSKALSSNITLNQDDVGDGTTYKQYSDTEKSKLSGIEASADVTDLTNVSSSINGASAATPVDADKFPFVDNDDNTIKTVTGANLKTYIGATPFDIHGLTDKNPPVDADEMPISDSADSNHHKKVTLAHLKTYIGAGSSFDIHGLSAETTMATGDEVPFYDVSASSAKKITEANLLVLFRNAVYPVGSVYICNSTSIDPNTSIGGTWQRIEGVGWLGFYDSDSTIGMSSVGAVSGGSMTKNLQHNHTLTAGAGFSQPAGAGNPNFIGTQNALSTAQDIKNAGYALCVWERIA